MLSKGAEKTVPFPPRPEGRGFSGTPMITAVHWFSSRGILTPFSPSPARGDG
ncbi:hypothetical protein CCP3SC1_100003 [Gammaproteobacteria bacterium]